MDTAPVHLIPQELVWNLDQDTRAITRQWIGADGTAVRQILKDLQTLTDSVVTGLTFDMCDETDTTCIMFIARVIQTLLRRQRRIVHLFLTSMVTTKWRQQPPSKIYPKGRECYLKPGGEGNLLGA